MGKKTGPWPFQNSKSLTKNNLPSIESSKIYYIDGYHGGTEGHMPFGCIRDILNTLREIPNWKISLELEPFSYDELKRRDPDSYFELKEYLQTKDYYSRLELVSGSYAQSYCWNIDGESNIRQLIFGLDILHKHFPNSTVDTYAVQEPCWTSALPQILLSLGFKRAVLKDPSTAFAGYTKGIDEHLIIWIGPDGSAIKTVPRYKCEKLLIAWATDCRFAFPEFLAKCIKNGLFKPAGMAFQDAGWKSQPRAKGDHIQYVTWREYIDKIAPKAENSYSFTQEHLEVTLPWGAIALQKLAKEVRKAEHTILQAEKLASLGRIISKFNFPTEQVARAWHNLLLAQHHDAWICVQSPHKKGTWGEEGISQSWQCQEICNEIQTTILDSVFSSTNVKQKKIAIINTTGYERNDLVEAQIPFALPYNDIRILDENGNNLECQIVPKRIDLKNRLNAATVLFRPKMSPLSMQYFSMDFFEKQVDSPREIKAELSCINTETLMVVESDLYIIHFDKKQGGIISRLYSKKLNREFVNSHNERKFNEIRGFFPLYKKWLSTADSEASISLQEEGPLRITLKIETKLGDFNVVKMVSISKGEERIDCSVRVHFTSETEIGEKWEGDCGPRRRRKPCYDSRYKLQVHFPVQLGMKRRLFKDAPFDVTESKLTDTFFNSWASIKNNVLLHWVDVTDENLNNGLALFTDRTTSYSHGPRYPLSLTLAWSGKGYWDQYYPILGYHSWDYAFMPHEKDWRDAKIPIFYSKWQEKCISRIVHNTKLPTAKSFIECSSENIEISTMLVKGGKLFVRLFNWGKEGSFNFNTNFKLKQIYRVDLKENILGTLKLQQQDEKSLSKLRMRSFELLTLMIML